jgi:hypothetical protein
MARHIQEEILQKDPSAKMLIWVGMGHACKAEVDGEAFMARRLWKLTGIEPYTIYQLSDGNDPKHDSSIYRWLVITAGRSVVLPQAVCLPAGVSFTSAPDRLKRHPIYSRMMKMGVDAVILHPASPVETARARPAWLGRGKATIRGKVTRQGQPVAGCLVQALPADEGADATPAGQVLTDVLGGYELKVLPGSYDVRVRSIGREARTERVLVRIPQVNGGMDRDKELNIDAPGR